MADATASAGGRFTYYSKSSDLLQTELLDEGTTRSYAEAGLSLVGPSFSRIYEASIGPYDKFKHVIEPRVEYNYVSDVSNPLAIPAFDEVDTALGMNQVHYAIVNRLLGRRAGGSVGSAEEIASLEIGQTYAFSLPQVPTSASPDDPLQKLGPVEESSGSRRVGCSLDGRIAYDTFRTDPSTSVTAGVNGSRLREPGLVRAAPFWRRCCRRGPRRTPIVRFPPSEGTWSRQMFAAKAAAENLVLRIAPFEPGLLLHDLRGVPGAAAPSAAAPRRPPRREPQGDRYAPRRQWLAGCAGLGVPLKIRRAGEPSGRSPSPLSV